MTTRVQERDSKLKHVRQYSHRIEDLAPLLEHDEFTLRGAGVPFTSDLYPTLNALLVQFSRMGLVEKAGKETYNDPDVDGEGGETKVWRYRWADGVREAFRAYKEDSDTLPCGCMAHIPDSRDDPDGIISCKHCGHEYDADEFREVVGV